MAGLSLHCWHNAGGCGAGARQCREQDGAIPGVSPCAEALPARAEGCPPARRELSSSLPGGEPASGC